MLKLKLKQYFCKHDFEYVGKQEHLNQNLWKCSKCNVYCIQHLGLGIYYLSKTPHLRGWIYKRWKDED